MNTGEKERLLQARDMVMAEIKEVKAALRAEKKHAGEVIGQLEKELEAEKAARHKRTSELETQLYTERKSVKDCKNLVIQLKTQLHDMEGELNRTEGYLHRVQEDDQMRDAQANPVTMVPERPGPRGFTHTAIDSGFGSNYGEARRVPWWEI